MESAAKNGQPASPDPGNDSEHFSPEDIDSTCSTPFASAPSSPGRGGFFYSCPASPMHFTITSSAAHRSSYDAESGGGGGGSCSVGSSSSSNSRNVVQLGYEFEFSARSGSIVPGHTGSMSSADELFLNGQIRPVKLSTHLAKPQILAPLLDLDEEEEEGEPELNNGDGNKKGFHGESRGRDVRLRNKSLRRRTRSMSPLRSSPLELADDEGGEEQSRKKKTGEGEEEEEEEDAAVDSAIDAASSSSTSRSSSAGRNSKRWVFLKEFLSRSKSEGRSNTKFWSNISFSPSKEKKGNISSSSSCSHGREKGTSSGNSCNDGASEKVRNSNNGGSGKKPVNGLGKKRVPAASPHELHYKASRAQAEELRKKTFLPYRQGLLGCLGFNSKGYGAINGFARALNPVSSR